MSEILELKDILELGNDGAPEEWLANLTGEGIGGGNEGIDDDIIEKLMNENDEDDPLLPNLPIEATPEIQFYKCNSANYTVGRGGKKITHIVVHYTSGKNTSEGAALANCKYFNRNSVGASAHFFVDSGYTIWQSVAESDTAWHAGNWAMNQRSIGIEVCSAGVFTNAEIERLTWLVQHLMKKYNIPASRVIRHYDVTGKKCPAYYVDNTKWKDLHARITTGKVSAPSKNQSNQAANPTVSSSGKINVVYQSKANGHGWLAEVTNWNNKNSNGYSGWLGKAILAFRAKTKGAAKDVGHLEYRAHLLKGGWLGWRRDYEKDTSGDTFAGTGKDFIDGVQFRIAGVSGKHVRYRVHVIGKGWLGWITDYGSGSNGYAGIYGYLIDAIQVEVV